MKRMTGLLAALLCVALCFSALALETDGTLSAVYLWPEDSTEADACFVYSAVYPRMAGEDDVSLTINETFSYLLEDAGAFTVPIFGEMLEAAGTRGGMTVTGTVTLLNEDYLSVLVVTETDTGSGVKHVRAGYTFALTGEDAGNVTTLPRLLGILSRDDDTWLEDRQTDKANRLARELVWERLEDSGAIDDSDLTEEDLETAFYP